jgi:hypothetical protein
MEAENVNKFVSWDSGETAWAEFCRPATTGSDLNVPDGPWQPAYTQLTDEFVISGVAGRSVSQRVVRRFANTSANRPRHARFETTEQHIGFPGETAGSTIEWPSLWRDPEVKESAREVVSQLSRLDPIELKNVGQFIRGAELCTSFSSSKIEETFKALKDEWRQATGILSDSIEICNHPAYQRIIGLGPSAVPLIIEELEKEPDHWFWALRAITGENPVPPDVRGRLDLMAEYWLHWFRQRTTALGARV